MIEEPVKTSDRKRPNKTFIQQMAKFRGHITENEKTQLETLKVKNIMQRVNNKAMSDEESAFTKEENIALQIIIDRFVKDVKQILNK